MHKFILVNKAEPSEESQTPMEDMKGYNFVEVGVRKEVPFNNQENESQQVNFQVVRLIHKNSLIEGIFWDGEKIGAIVKLCFNDIALEDKKITEFKGTLFISDDENQDVISIGDRTGQPYYILYATDNFEHSLVDKNDSNEGLSPFMIIRDLSLQTGSNYSQPHGLGNLGNTCFMNSGLQCLLAVTPFINRLLSFKTGEMGKTFSELLLQKKQPRDFWGIFTDKVKRFGDYMQHDVQEFIGCLLDCIDIENREIIKDKLDDNDKGQTIIESCFEGQLCSKVTCTACKHVFTVFEPFFTLSLPIPFPENFHPGIFYAGRVCKKLKIPRNLTVKDVKQLLYENLNLRKEFNNSGDDINNNIPVESKFMIVSINANKRVVLQDDILIGNYSMVFCFEYIPNESYSWVVLKRKGLIFDNFVGHFLLKHGDDVYKAINDWISSVESQRVTRENSLLKNVNYDISIENETPIDINFNSKESIDGHSSSIKKGKSDISSASSIETRTSSNEKLSGAGNHNDKKQRPRYNFEKSALICDLNPEISFFKSIKSEQIVTIKKPLQYNVTNKVALEDCISHFISKEKLTDTNEPYCINCKAKTEHTKEMKLSKLPECLVIHLKRFAYSGSTKKILTKVAIDNYLKINNMKYKLVSFANHKAKSVQSGHYTAYIHRAGKWWLCNDSSINEVPHFKDEEAYLLFYEMMK